MTPASLWHVVSSASQASAWRRFRWGSQGRERRDETETRGAKDGKGPGPSASQRQETECLDGQDEVCVWSVVAGACRWLEKALVPEPLAAVVLLWGVDGG